MREASGKKLVAEWKIELGKRHPRKRTPKVLNRAVKYPNFVFQLTIEEIPSVHQAVGL